VLFISKTSLVGEDNWWEPGTCRFTGSLTVETTVVRWMLSVRSGWRTKSPSSARPGQLQSQQRRHGAESVGARHSSSGTVQRTETPAVQVNTFHAGAIQVDYLPQGRRCVVSEGCKQLWLCSVSPRSEQVCQRLKIDTCTTWQLWTSLLALTLTLTSTFTISLQEIISSSFGKMLPVFSGIRRYFCLPRDAMLARYMLSLCVYLSVRPSVTSRYCTKTANNALRQRWDTTFLLPKISAKFCRGQPQTGRQIQVESV